MFLMSVVDEDKNVTWALCEMFNGAFHLHKLNNLRLWELLSFTDYLIAIQLQSTFSEAKTTL